MKDTLTGIIYYEDGYMNYPNAFGTHDSMSYVGFNIIDTVHRRYGYNSNEYQSLASYVHNYREFREKFSGTPAMYWDTDRKKWELYDEHTSVELFIKFCRLQQKLAVV